MHNLGTRRDCGEIAEAEGKGQSHFKTPNRHSTQGFRRRRISWKRAEHSPTDGLSDEDLEAERPNAARKHLQARLATGFISRRSPPVPGRAEVRPRRPVAAAKCPASRGHRRAREGKSGSRVPVFRQVSAARRGNCAKPGPRGTSGSGRLGAGAWRPAPGTQRPRKEAEPEIGPGRPPGRDPDSSRARPAPHLQRARADRLSGRLAAPPPGARLPGRPPAPTRAPATSSHRRAAPPRAAAEARRSRAPPAAAIAGGPVTTVCDAGAPHGCERLPSAGVTPGPRAVRAGASEAARTPARAFRCPISPSAERAPPPAHAAGTGFLGAGLSTCCLECVLVNLLTRSCLLFFNLHC